MSVDLVFAASFFVFLNTCTVFTCLPEGKRLWVMQTIVAFVVGVFVKGFPPREDGQTASQRKLIVSEASQPAVRIICRSVGDAEDARTPNASVNVNRKGRWEGRDMTRSERRRWTMTTIVLIVTLASGLSCALAEQPDTPPAASLTAPVRQPVSAEVAEAVKPALAGTVPAVRSEGSSRSPDPRAGMPHDLSPLGMFAAADWVVKGVMVGLAFASLVTWMVLFVKAVEIACAQARAQRAFDVITASHSLAAAEDTLIERGGPAAFMVRSASEEMARSAAALDFAGNDGLKERVVSRLVRIEAQAGRRLTRGTGLLATIGSTAPFVGLFGTVWGIMNAFIGISQAQTTNLAVVAPGIAEALLATAMGLVAAIPAVVLYNVFARTITGYRQLLADVAAGVERLVSRDLDFRKVPDAAGRAALPLAAE